VSVKGDDEEESTLGKTVMSLLLYSAVRSDSADLGFENRLGFCHYYSPIDYQDEFSSLPDSDSMMG
jgi:hypothetical protein